MKRIFIRELHDKTGEYVRQVADIGKVHVTDRGKTVGKLVPQHDQRLLVPAAHFGLKGVDVGRPAPSSAPGAR